MARHSGIRYGGAIGGSMRLRVLIVLLVIFAGPAADASADVEEFSTRGQVEFTTSWGWEVSKWKTSRPTLPLPASLKPPNCPASIVIYIHGFQNTAAAATSNFNTAATSLANAGYAGTVYGFSWDSDAGKLGFDHARMSADLNGKVLAQVLKDIKQCCPTTKINILTHSLGARVALAALECGGCAHSVQMLGPAVDNEVLEEDEEFGDPAIGSNAGTLMVWYNDEDDVLGTWYPPEEGDSALGSAGSEHGGGCLPGNVFQLNAEPKLKKTDSEDNHSGYILSAALMDCVVKWLKS